MPCVCNVTKPARTGTTPFAHTQPLPALDYRQSLRSCSCTAPYSQAATYTWTPTGTGPYNWNDASSNWTSGFPDAPGAVANITSNAGNFPQTINLNTGITVGTLNLGAGANCDYTIAAGTGGSLTFDAGTGGTAYLTDSTPTDGYGQRDQIVANVTLNSPLTINMAAIT